MSRASKDILIFQMSSENTFSLRLSAWGKQPTSTLLEKRCGGLQYRLFGKVALLVRLKTCEV